MSIDHKLAALEDVGRLVRYVPSVETDERRNRRIFMVPVAHEWCCPEGRHPDRRVSDLALAYAHQQLNAFVYGRYLELDIDIKQLDPGEDEVWEIRTLLVPRIRPLGWFPLPNTFVVVAGKLRDDLGSRPDPKWRLAVDEVKSQRDALLPGIRPFRGSRFEHYVT